MAIDNSIISSGPGSNAAKIFGAIGQGTDTTIALLKSNKRKKALADAGGDYDVAADALRNSGDLEGSDVYYALGKENRVRGEEKNENARKIRLDTSMKDFNDMMQKGKTVTEDVEEDVAPTVPDQQVSDLKPGEQGPELPSNELPVPQTSLTPTKIPKKIERQEQYSDEEADDLFERKVGMNMKPDELAKMMKERRTTRTDMAKLAAKEVSDQKKLDAKERADEKKAQAQIDLEDKRAEAAQQRLEFNAQKAEEREALRQSGATAAQMRLFDQQLKIQQNALDAAEARADKKASAAAEKSLTESQGKVATFATRIEDAEKDMKDLGDMGFNPSGVLGTIQRNIWSPIAGEKGQRYEQAKANFINATLRRESGASIRDEEFMKAEKQYFPTLNDSKGTIEQKKRNREAVLAGFKSESGPGYNRIKNGQAPVTPAAPAPKVRVWNPKTRKVE